MNTKLRLTILFISSIILTFGQFKAEKKLILMGSDFQIVCIAESQTKAVQAVDDAIAEIKNLELEISSWNKNSFTSKINNNAGIAAIKVSDNLFYLIKRANKLSEISEGAFDITINPLFDVWRFHDKDFSFPNKEEVESKLNSVSYKKIVLNEEQKTIFLTKKGMKIGKGFAADMAKKLLLKKGIENGLINASGDLCAWGKDIGGKEWKIAVRNPKEKDNYSAWIDISNKAVATSGNYEKFIEHDGQKYSHILNPKTGYPVLGVQSVTVISPTAELSDGFATTAFVLGVIEGMVIVNAIDNLECIILDNEGEIHYSKNIKINTNE
jgi:thiamine biosynthesis lipoprotein